MEIVRGHAYDLELWVPVKYKCRPSCRPSFLVALCFMAFFVVHLSSVCRPLAQKGAKSDNILQEQNLIICVFINGYVNFLEFATNKLIFWGTRGRRFKSYHSDQNNELAYHLGYQLVFLFFATISISCFMDLPISFPTDSLTSAPL